MGRAKRQSHVRRTSDRDTPRELASAVFAALERAELPEAMDLVRDRVLSLTSEQLFDTTVIIDGRTPSSFKPVVELLFRHIADVAAQEALPRDERLRQIAWALDMCGL